jgi:hypothetical protein
MSNSLLRATWLFCVLAARATGLLAQAAPPGEPLELSLAEAQAMAIAANPYLRSVAYRPAAARADVRSAGAFAYNPEFTV